MTRVEVRPELLRWARERARQSADDLGSRFPKLRDWEEGAVRPTMKQLEAYAKATHAPVGFLFLPEPPLRNLRAEVQHQAPGGPLHAVADFGVCAFGGAHFLTTPISSELIVPVSQHLWPVEAVEIVQRRYALLRRPPHPASPAAAGNYVQGSQLFAKVSSAQRMWPSKAQRRIQFTGFTPEIRTSSPTNLRSFFKNSANSAGVLATGS